MLRCHLSVTSECYLWGLGCGVHPYAKNLPLKYLLVKLEQSMKGWKMEVQCETMGMEGCLL